VCYRKQVDWAIAILSEQDRANFMDTIRGKGSFCEKWLKLSRLNFLKRWHNEPRKSLRLLFESPAFSDGTFGNRTYYPHRKTGYNNESNLWLACPLCNRYKGDKTAAVDPETDGGVH
jgi:hypothetical protein